MKSTLLASVLLFCCIFISGCVNQSTKTANWPSEIPPRDYFEDLYEADANNKKMQPLKDYLMWVTRFYEGWELYRNGWTKVTQDSLRTVKNPAAAAEIKMKMDLIGKIIAGEWSKAKANSRIQTRHIAIWGNALVESIKRNEELALINRVLADAAGLVEQKIGADDVTAERYYPKDKDDVFG